MYIYICICIYNIVIGIVCCRYSYSYSYSHSYSLKYDIPGSVQLTLTLSACLPLLGKTSLTPLGPWPNPDQPRPPARVATPPTSLAKGKGSKIPAGLNDQRPGSRSSVADAPTPSYNEVPADPQLPRCLSQGASTCRGKEIGVMPLSQNLKDKAPVVKVEKVRGISGAEPTVWRSPSVVFRFTINKTALVACSPTIVTQHVSTLLDTQFIFNIIPAWVGMAQQPLSQCRQRPLYLSRWAAWTVWDL